MTITWQAEGGTHTGRRRQNNEDALLIDVARGIFLVADGMGGHAGGEVASALATQAAEQALVHSAEPRSGLSEAFASASAAISDFALRNPRMRGMGTTLTACVVQSDGSLHLGHIGDSRAYRLRDEILEQITTDHTWVQREVDAGRLSARAARTHALSHVITHALGVDDGDQPDLLTTTAAPDDLLLLCSDGLTGMLDDDELTHLLLQDTPLSERVDGLIRAANAAGGVDNITVVLVRILKGTS